MCTKTSSQTTETMPLLCRFWTTLLKQSPTLRVFGIDIGLTILSALFLTVVRVVAEKLLLEILFGWPVNSLVTKVASSSVAAIVHSMNLVPALLVCFVTMRKYNPSSRMMEEGPPYWRDTVDALLQFCTGYMIYDGLLNIVWLKYSMTGGLQDGDAQFLGHHFATTFYMTSTRLIGAGHQSAMVCMFLGELTNPLHNLYYVLEAAQTLDCCNGELSQLAFWWVEFLFSAMYVVIRALIAPIVFLHMMVNLWTIGRRYINVGLLAFWSILIWGVAIGSIPWIIDSWSSVKAGLGGESQEL